MELKIIYIDMDLSGVIYGSDIKDNSVVSGKFIKYIYSGDELCVLLRRVKDGGCYVVSKDSISFDVGVGEFGLHDGGNIMLNSILCVNNITYNIVDENPLGKYDLSDDSLGSVYIASNLKFIKQYYKVVHDVILGISLVELDENSKETLNIRSIKDFTILDKSGKKFVLSLIKIINESEITKLGNYDFVKDIIYSENNYNKLYFKIA